MNTSLMLAAISGQGLVNLLIWVIVAGVIYWIAMWAINTIQPPEPFRKIAIVVLVLAVAVILINALLTLAGHPLIRF